MPLAWLLVAGPALAAIAAAAWVLVRSAQISSSVGEGVRTRIGEDGFWLRVAAGATVVVHYEYVVDGTTHTNTATIDGGEETFVPTGKRPSGVRILEVAEMRPSSASIAPPAPFPLTPPSDPILSEEEKQEGGKAGS